MCARSAQAHARTAKLIRLKYNAEVIEHGASMTTIPDDLQKILRDYHRAQKEFQKGNPQPLKDICSHADDVTIIGGMGGVEKGWVRVEKRYEWASSKFASKDEDEHQNETVSLVATPEMAYAVEIERGRIRVAGSDRIQDLVLRVTTIFRREHAEWKLVHRHADPLIEVQPPAVNSQE
jgi:ketosteroid isomerase-like protein